MNNRDKYLAALDIGSSKICCIIASRDQYDISKIIGLGYNEAKGISNGIISDFNAAIKSISSAISEAEKQADLKINEINISASSKVVNTKLFNQKINILEDRIKQDDINESLNLVMKEPSSVLSWCLIISASASILTPSSIKPCALLFLDRFPFTPACNSYKPTASSEKYFL